MASTSLVEKQTQPEFTCSKLTIETLEQGAKYAQIKVNNQNDAIGQFRGSGVLIVNCKHISHLVLVFVLLTLNI